MSPRDLNLAQYDLRCALDLLQISLRPRGQIQTCDLALQQIREVTVRLITSAEALARQKRIECDETAKAEKQRG